MADLSLISVSLVAFGTSLLTFYAGFGLGTILMPVFALYFSLAEAIALTAIVHFLNNLFKLGLVYTKIAKAVLLKFSLVAIPFALVGSLLLGHIDATPFYSMGILHFSYLKLAIGCLLLFFAVYELIPSLSELSFDKKHLLLGGAISGFFGGLSGHQGALRAAFLIKLNLSKEAFIATGIAIACCIDLTRLAVYYQSINAIEYSGTTKTLLIAATLSAFAGAYIGSKLLKKTTIRWIQKIVGALLVIYALLLMVGLL